MEAEYIDDAEEARERFREMREELLDDAPDNYRADQRGTVAQMGISAASQSLRDGDLEAAVQVYREAEKLLGEAREAAAEYADAELGVEA